MKDPYHVVRNGQPLGQFLQTEIIAKLEDGTLLPDDRIFLSAERTWISLHDWLARLAMPVNDAPADSTSLPTSNRDGHILTVYTAPPPQHNSKSNDRYSRSKKKRHRHRNRLSGDDFTEGEASVGQRESNYQRRRRQAKFTKIFYGWIVAAFALVVAVAFYTWGISYKKQVAGLREWNEDLKEQVRAHKERNRALLQPVPTGQVAGIVGIEDTDNGKFFALASATVTLYRRADVEAFIEQHSSAPSPTTDEEIAEFIQDFQNAMPRPEGTDLTNSDGAFHFSIPNPGDYVLLVVPNKVFGGPQVVWLQGVRTGGPTQKILLTDQEALTAVKFHFKITPPQGSMEW